jgi:hypothetical protein
MASLYKPGVQATAVGNKGAAAIYLPTGTGDINVINDFTWTLTPPRGRKEIPSIILKEFQVDESTIRTQFDFYFNNAGSAFTPSTTDFLAPYDQLFPKDKETGFEYTFPFYNDINFEVNTPQWASLDTLEAAKRGVVDLVSLVSPSIGESAGRGIDLGANVIGVAMAGNYPKVGIMDRPKLWTNHDFRSYTVKFPLYNTYNSDPSKPGGEWIKNRELCELLVNQNLYNKLSFITGIPPVFYEVLIPGQHYAYAACVTNLSIYNRGNIRQLSKQGGELCNVPDVYEVNITLTDLVIPSKNQFQAISNQAVRTESRRRSGIIPKTESTPSIPSNNPGGSAGSGDALGSDFPTVGF